jgi:hypothetical protein
MGSHIFSLFHAPTHQWLIYDNKSIEQQLKFVLNIHIFFFNFHNFFWRRNGERKTTRWHLFLLFYFFVCFSLCLILVFLLFFYFFVSFSLCLMMLFFLFLYSFNFLPLFFKFFFSFSVLFLLLVITYTFYVSFFPPNLVWTQKMKNVLVPISQKVTRTESAERRSNRR